MTCKQAPETAEPHRTASRRAADRRPSKAQRDEEAYRARIEQIVAEAPPLTDEQSELIARLLRPYMHTVRHS